MRKHRVEAPILRWLVTIAWLLGCGLTSGLVVADTLDESWCWRTCKPVGAEVTHSVMLRDSVTGDLRQRKLVGPVGLVLPSSGDSCLGCYRIEAAATPAAAGRLQLTLPGGGNPVVVLVGPPRAALLPAQLLRDGPPAGEPGSVAYEERAILQVEGGSGDRWASVCLPVEYRHHFERLTPPAGAAAFVLSKGIDPVAAGEIVGLVDDLGTSRIGFGDMQQTIARLIDFSVLR